MIKAGEISEIIKRQLAGYEPEVDLQEVGRVIEVGDGIARIYGLEKAMAGELLQFPGGEALVGRVVNALGQPVDGKGPIAAKEFRPIERYAPGVVDRRSVKES